MAAMAGGDPTKALGAERAALELVRAEGSGQGGRVLGFGLLRGFVRFKLSSPTRQRWIRQNLGRPVLVSLSSSLGVSLVFLRCGI